MKLSQFNVVHEHNGSLLIMNARTGGILSLNPEYAQKFKRIQEGDVRDADDLVAELIRGGILVNEERDELGEIRLQSRAARFANTALSLTIAPTMACNFCCPYCYEKGQAYTTMGEEVLTQLSKFVKDLLSWYRKSLSWMVRRRASARNEDDRTDYVGSERCRGANV